MNGVLKASVSAGSSHLAASVTCRPQRISPSAAAAGRLGRVSSVKSRISATPRVSERVVVMADTLGPRMGKVKRTLGELLSAHHVEGVIEERRQALDEADGVGEARVGLEGRLVPPARVDVEEPWIARGAEGANADAAWLSARRPHDVAHGVGHRL